MNYYKNVQNKPIILSMMLAVGIRKHDHAANALCVRQKTDNGRINKYLL